MSKPNTDVIVRTVVLGVTWLNLTLTGSGYNPLPWGDEEVALGVSAAVTFGASMWAWWKNNSLTEDAQFADEVLDDLKTNK